MGNLWLKIKIWSKIILAGALLLFAMLFILKNKDKPVEVWLWNPIQTTVLQVLLFTVIFSVVGSFLIATAFRTLRQIRDLRERTKQANNERVLAEMHAKAAMLQTKSVDAGTKSANSQGSL